MENMKLPLNDVTDAVEKAAGTYRKFPVEFERIVCLLLIIGSYFLGKNDMKELYQNCQKINDDILKTSISNLMESKVKKEENTILKKEADSLRVANDSLKEDSQYFRSLKSEIKKPIEKILK